MWSAGDEGSYVYFHMFITRFQRKSNERLILFNTIPSPRHAIISVPVPPSVVPDTPVRIVYSRRIGDWVPWSCVVTFSSTKRGKKERKTRELFARRGRRFAFRQSYTRTSYTIVIAVIVTNEHRQTGDSKRVNNTGGNSLITRPAYTRNDRKSLDPSRTPVLLINTSHCWFSFVLLIIVKHSVYVYIYMYTVHGFVHYTYARCIRRK